MVVSAVPQSVSWDGIVIKKIFVIIQIIAAKMHCSEQVCELLYDEGTGARGSIK